MSSSQIVSRGNVYLKRRAVAPGEVELAIVATLQMIVGVVLLFAPARLLAGNGTALMTAASQGELVSISVKTLWAGVFFFAGYLCLRAIRKPSTHTRKWAWQVVIPLWAMWLVGFLYPAFVGLPTNAIVLTMQAALVAQWLVTRFLVPLDSHWYDREVPLAQSAQTMGETPSVVAGSGGGSTH